MEAPIRRSHPAHPSSARKAARVRLRTAALLAVALASAAPAHAQFLPRIDFNFSNPGARSLGFGGAFAGLADDATAAFANPAGLVQLTRPEISLEGRSWSGSTSFIAGGRDDGSPTGLGIDTTDGLVFGHDDHRSTSPSFAAAVWPRGRWTLAVYGHRLADLRTSAESQGVFQDDFFLPRQPATRDRTELTLNGAGVAAGWRANERLSLGIAVVHMDLSLESRGEAFLPDFRLPDFYQPIPFDDAHRFTSSTLLIDDAATSVSAGLLWGITDQLSGGLFYRRGPRLDGSFELVALPFFGDPEERFTLDSEIRIPDVWGGGIAFRSASGKVTVAGELDRVGYAGLLQVASSEEVTAIGRDYADSWEYHLGAEYALLDHRPIIAFRSGAWVDSHSNDLERDHVTHWAAGVGVAGDRVQLDLAADLSSLLDTVSLSLIYSF